MVSMLLSDGSGYESKTKKLALEVSLLGFYLATKLLELADNPFATLVVRFAP